MRNDSLVSSNSGEFGAQVFGQSVHCGTADAGFGFGVVVGIDVVGVDDTIRVGMNSMPVTSIPLAAIPMAARKVS